MIEGRKTKGRKDLRNNPSIDASIQPTLQGRSRRNSHGETHKTKLTEMRKDGSNQECFYFFFFFIPFFRVSNVVFCRFFFSLLLRRREEKSKDKEERKKLHD